MNNYTSKDFGKTENQLSVHVPEKLIHKDVGRSQDAAFSTERKHPVSVVDLPSKTISVTLGGLDPGTRSNKHRHNYETILYILEGEGSTFVQEREVKWKAGDAVYVPVWAWHYHENASTTAPCRYLACENAPLLQNLGAALREES
jgi:quercetin dioxygenase-like cupin family protein